MSEDFHIIDNDSGSALCKTVIHDGDEYQLPVDYSFESINNYVHNMDRHYEELQYLALGMASHGDRLRQQLEIAVGALEENKLNAEAGLLCCTTGARKEVFKQIERESDQAIAQIRELEK